MGKSNVIHLEKQIIYLLSKFQRTTGNAAMVVLFFMVAANKSIEETISSQNELIILINENINSGLFKESKIENYKNEIERINNSIEFQNKLISDYKNDLSNYKGFENYGEIALRQLIRVIGNQETVNTTVDGSGKFSLNIYPGEYKIIFISEGRESLNIVENQGKVKIHKIRVKEKEIVNVDAKFEI